MDSDDLEALDDKVDSEVSVMELHSNLEVEILMIFSVILLEVFLDEAAIAIDQEKEMILSSNLTFHLNKRIRD
ncbi:hypothetical protein KA478_02250 [Patescibacteria group bacterium]|nr:hypothetical protein [Patescibacteria group bacterium]